MTITLPEYAAAAGAQALELVDVFYRDRSAQPGIGTVDCGGPPDGQVWLVDRAVVTTSGQATQATVELLLVQGGTAPQLRDLLDTTASGLYDVGDYPPSGLLVPEGSTVLAAWVAGLTPQGVPSVRLQVRQLRKVR